MDVKIVDFPQTHVAMLQHRGSPDRVNDSAATFIAWRKATGLSPVRESSTFGIAWDDPAFGIDWGVVAPILSEKDRTARRLSEIAAPFPKGSW